MADGVRIRFVGAEVPDNALIIVRDITRPFTPAPDQICRLCHRPHDCKTYHIQLNGDGTALVSTTIWKHLSLLYDDGGFELVNTVKEPPAQKIAMPTAVAKVKPSEM